MSHLTHTDKSNWIETLRAIATLSVIVLHVAAPILYQFSKISTDTWWIGNFFDGSMRFGVPIFLMITGALILPKTYKIKQFLKQRASKILLPFLFWSIIYIGYALLNAKEVSLSNGIYYSLQQLKKGAAYHLWYIYMLLGMYLCMPMISKWIINSTKKEIEYFILIWLFVIALQLPFIAPYVPNINFFYFSGYLGYPILGYYLAHQVQLKQSNLKIGLFIIIGTLITVIGTYFMSLYHKGLSTVFYGFLSPNVLLTAIGIFLLAKQSSINHTTLNLFVKTIAKYSYGIYLSHIFVLMHLAKFNIKWDLIHPAIGILTTSALCLIISLFITFTLHKIPYGKHISG